MKRDMDLVRKILLACEAEPSGWGPEQPLIEGYTSDQIGYHVMLMHQAGLVEARNATNSRTPGPFWLVGHLTWEGHEFLDASRDEGNWATAKAVASKIGGFAFDTLKTILVRIAADKIGQSMHT